MADPLPRTFADFTGAGSLTGEGGPGRVPLVFDQALEEPDAQIALYLTHLGATGEVAAFIGIVLQIKEELRLAAGVDHHFPTMVHHHDFAAEL